MGIWCKGDGCGWKLQGKDLCGCKPKRVNSFVFHRDLHFYCIFV